MPVIGTLELSLDKGDKGVSGALPVVGPDSRSSAIGEIARLSFRTSCVVARRAAGRWGSCTSVDSASLSSKVPIPLSLDDAELFAAFAGRSCESGALAVARESFLVLLSLVVWRGGEAMYVVVSSDTYFSRRCPIRAVHQYTPRFCRSMLTLTFVSSNGRHLKSFL